jgi:exopolysaccharide biosynthesis polyprenyl glycosylphosphotransferase
MTDLKKTDTLGNPWQAEDIRATNLSVRWQHSLIGIQSIVLVGLDVVMLYASWTISDMVGTPVAGAHVANSMIPILAVSIGTLATAGFYGTDDKLNRFSKLFKSLTVAQIVVLIAAFFYQPGLWISRSVFVIAWLLNFLFIGGARFAFDLLKIQLRKHNPVFQHPVVLLGNRQDIHNVKKLIERSQQFKVDSIIDLSIWDLHTELEQVIQYICSRQVSEVFICTQDSIDNQIILFWSLKAAGIHLRMIPSETQLPQRSAETKMIEEIPTSRFKSLPIFGINFLMKRLFDIIAATVISILLSPLLVATAIAVKKTSSGPIFYRQYRVGLKGNRFQVWKFRTMVENASELQKELEAQNEVKGGVLFKIKEDPRITKIGKFLRKYSIDELPQLINVLQGQMSLVGPRPLPVRDYERSLENMEQFSRERFLRYEVLPGITGLWQVKGRSSVDSDEIFYWDMVYILQWSLALDLKILLQTIKVVVSKEGSY